VTAARVCAVAGCPHLQPCSAHPRASEAAGRPGIAVCDRCGGRLLRQWDELVCLVDGTRVSPERPWDRVVDERGPTSKRPMAPMAGRPWSPRDRHWVLANADRMSSREMARRLQRTEHAVNQVLSKAARRKARVRNLDTVRNRLRPVDLLEDAVRPGLTRRLAGRMGMSYRAAYLRLWRRGVLVREADGHLSIAEVAEEYGCTRRRVLTLVRHGLLPAERLARTVVRIAPEDAERVAPLLRARSKHASRGGGGSKSSAGRDAQ